jgi:hypothetical protein
VVRTGEPAATTSTSGDVEISEIGAKSFTGSNGAGPRLTLIAFGATLPISSV